MLELWKVEIDEFLNYPDGIAMAGVSEMVWPRSVSMIRIVTEIRKMLAPKPPLG
jgi:hypothetical protein